MLFNRLLRLTVPFFFSTLGLLITFLPNCWAANRPAVQKFNHCHWACQWGHHIGLDYQHFYSGNNLLKLAGGFAVGAVIANTDLDQRWSDAYQDHVRTAQTNDISVQFKHFGNPLFALTYIGGYAIGKLAGWQTITGWSQRSIRALLVGLPPMWLMQRVTGGDRPSEHENSHWHFWGEDHGVSGHAFMGAVPFLTAASMTHNWLLKTTFYLGASMAGLSRINDNQHYPSQVLLGWWMAYLAVNSVNQTHSQLTLTPMLLPNGGGVVLSTAF